MPIFALLFTLIWPFILHSFSEPGPHSICILDPGSASGFRIPDPDALQICLERQNWLWSLWTTALKSGKEMVYSGVVVCYLNTKISKKCILFWQGLIPRSGSKSGSGSVLRFYVWYVSRLKQCGSKTLLTLLFAFILPFYLHLSLYRPFYIKFFHFYSFLVFLHIFPNQH